MSDNITSDAVSVPSPLKEFLAENEAVVSMIVFKGRLFIATNKALYEARDGELFELLFVTGAL